MQEVISWMRVLGCLGDGAASERFFAALRMPADAWDGSKRHCRLVAEALTRTEDWLELEYPAGSTRRSKIRAVRRTLEDLAEGWTVRRPS